MRFRVFAALELPPHNQARLGEALTGLQAAAPPGSVRWVRPEAMHLTVKFLGDVDSARLPAVETALAEAASGAQPLHLSLAGLGVFPHARRPQVIWAGVQGDVDKLQALQAALEAKTTALRFAPEGRAYKPHMTLGRVHGDLLPADLQRLLQHLAANQHEPLGEFEADTLTLMRSDLRPAGPVYTRLFAARLGEPSRRLHAPMG